MGRALPPCGSTVTKTESISARTRGSSNLSTQRFCFLIVYIEDPQAFSRTLGWTACTPNRKDAFRFAVL